MTALAPLALKGMVDAIASARNPGGVPLLTLSLAAAYVVALCGSRALNELGPWLSGTAEQRLCDRLRRRFFSHLLRLPLGFHVDRHSGAVMHCLYQATAGFHVTVASLVNTLVPVAVETIAVVLVLSHLDQPSLVLTFIATAAAYLLIFGFGTIRLARQSQQVSAAALAMHASLADHLANVETIKTFCAEGTALGGYAGASGRLASSWSKLLGKQAGVGLTVSATFTLSVCVSVALTSDAVLGGSLSLGGFVLANLYMVQIVRPLELAGSAARDLSQAIEFIRPLLDILNEPIEASQKNPVVHIVPPAAAVVARTRSSAAFGVRFRNVHFAYDDKHQVLAGLELDVEPGRTLAIVGASGSGKSSIARLLLGLYQPQLGEILLNDRSIDALRPIELRAMIGVVPQETALFHDTIALNIGIGSPGCSLADIQSAARLAHLHDFVASLPAGYDTVVGERGMKLSGGERQRIAIARAVLKHPRMYVFDEATSMLDSQTEASIRQNLQEISKDCTTITIAHRLSTVQDADEIVVLDRGHVCERGRHSALLAGEGTYARLWALQMRQSN